MLLYFIVTLPMPMVDVQQRTEAAAAVGAHRGEQREGVQPLSR